MRLGKAALHRSSIRGFTMVWALGAVALVGLSAAQVSHVWSAQVQRDKERELIRIGATYALAIERYYWLSPGGAKRYPPDLESLLLDQRALGTLRYLRTLYPDPMQPGRPWGLVRNSQNQVIGVYSTSERKPLKTTPSRYANSVLPVADRYSEWKFIAPGATQEGPLR